MEKKYDSLNIFAQNIQFRYTLEPPRRYNVCFGSKMRKLGESREKKSQEKSHGKSHKFG